MFKVISFIRNVYNNPRALFERPNRPKCENRESTEILGNSVKNGRFRPSKYQNSVIYQDIYLKLCTHIAPDSVISHVCIPFFFTTCFPLLFNNTSY